MKKIALGISSSISIYKSCEIIRGFQKKDIEVQVLMTKNATKLISPLLFSALTGKEVIIDPLSERSGTTIAHVSLAKEISLFLVAPATANIIGKFASGVADDFLSTSFLTIKCPVLVAPSMNEAMYFNKQTQENIQSLKTRGVKFVEPEKGYLACQEEGWGRLAEPKDIIKQGLRLIKKGKSLKGKTFLITAGSTQEPLDPVRFLTNRSSGKMGYELAEEALSRGAKVILVSGPTHIFPPVEAEVREVRSAAEMEKEVLAHFDRTDIVVMAAAVSDFKFAKQSSDKIKKQELTKKAELVPTSDILKKLGQKKGKKILIGFAAETEKIQDNALEKLKRKNLDLVVANNVAEKGIGFESDYNQVFILEGKGEVIQTEKMSKREISGVILDKLEEIIGKRRRKTSK